VRLEEVAPEPRAPGARPHLPVDKDAPLAGLEQIAPRFPVFLVVPKGKA
jgi:hypothetical protein